MAEGCPNPAWTNPSPPSQRPQKPNRVAFSSFKQRTKVFFNKITVNLKHNPHLKWKRAVECWNLFCKTFTYHYNHLRR
jgi:hypothetical protein